MKQLKALTTEQIKRWGLSLSQLKAYLQRELQNSQELQNTLTQVQEELSQISLETAQQVKFTTLQLNKLAENSMEANSLIAAITQVRQQNITIQAKIGQVKNQIKQAQQTKQKLSASDRHDKYARVMEALKSQAADIRTTYSSDDVLEMDDIAIEENITYEEAKERVDQKKVSWRTGEAPPADL